MFRRDLSQTEKEMYFQGARDALTAFSVWKDGVQVTNDMRTLKEAIATVQKEMEYTPIEIADRKRIMKNQVMLILTGTPMNEIEGKLDDLLEGLIHV